MTARFAALEARANRAVFSRLANADCTLAGLAFTGIFDAAYQLADAGNNGMASTGPVLTLPTAQVPANAAGQAVLVNGVSFTVAAHQPDGTGISLLLLKAVR